MKVICFPPSESSRDFTLDEKLFIHRVLNGPNAWPYKWKVTLNPREADWLISLESQWYIDLVSDIHRHSATFALLTPKVTMISLDEWLKCPDPKDAFDGLIGFRKYLLLLECARAFKIDTTAFRSANTTSFNNKLIFNNNSEWLT